MRERPRPFEDRARRRAAPAAQRRRAGYEVIALEPRLLLQATFTGTEGADEITISRGAFNQGFAVRINGVHTFTTESSARVNALGGNDTVLIAELDGVAGADLTIDLGAGDDLVANTGSLRFMTYSPRIIGGDGDDTLALDNSRSPSPRAFGFVTASFFLELFDVKIADSSIEAGSQAFRYGTDLERITLDGGPVDESVLLEAKPASLRLTANGRGGDDAFFAGYFRGSTTFPFPIPERAVNFSNPDNGWIVGTTTLTGGDSGGDRIVLEDRRADAGLPYVFGIGGVNRGFAGFTYSAFNQQSLFSAPNSPVQINAISGFITSTTINSNDNTVNVGNGNLFYLSGAITVVGGEGTGDVVNVNDSTSPAGRTYDVFHDRLTTSVGITVNYPTDPSGAVEAVELHTGGSADSITVHDSEAGRLVNIDAGGGNDEVYVGSGRLDALAGPVSASGGPGIDGIRFDDARGTAFDDAVITSSSFALAGGPVHTYLSMERITMLAGEAGSRTEVRSLSAPLSATGGPGDDVMVVGGGNSDANLAPAAYVTFDGFSGDDRLELDDRLDVNNPAGADNYLFDFGEVGLFRQQLIRKLGPGASDVLVGGVRIDGLVLHASDDANAMLVQDAATAVRINANGGNDYVAVDDVLDGGSVAVDTGGGADRLDVNGDLDSDDDIGAGNFPAAVTLDRSDEIADLNVRQRGTLRVTAGAVLTATPATGFVLEGVIDLAGGAMVLRESAGGVEAVNALVRAGHHGGAWDGVSNSFGSSLGAGAIHSSTAAELPGVWAVGSAPAGAVFARFPATFLGQAIGPNDMLLRCTAVGDANLNGRVDVTDVARARRNQGRLNTRWDQGNFNFDGGTSVLDIILQRRHAVT